MKQLTKDTLKNLLANLKVAAKDRVDLVMFGCLIFFCFKEMIGVYANLAFGFVAFYVFFLLIRNAAFKRQIEELKKQK